MGRGEPRDRARRQRFVISRHRLLGADDRNRPRLVLSASAIASRSRPMTSRTRRSRIHPTWRSRSDHSTIGSRRPCRAADVRAHAPPQARAPARSRSYATLPHPRTTSHPRRRQGPATRLLPWACGSAEAAVRGRGSRWATLEKGAAGSDCEVLAGKGHAGDRSGLRFREGWCGSSGWVFGSFTVKMAPPSGAFAAAGSWLPERRQRRRLVRTSSPRVAHVLKARAHAASPKQKQPLGMLRTQGSAVDPFVSCRRALSLWSRGRVSARSAGFG